MHFAQQRFAEGGVLVGLLVLAIFPGMRRRNHRESQPFGRALHNSLMACKNQLLTYRPEHLDAESFIAGDQIQSALVTQAGRYYRLFVERRDDPAIHGLQCTFRITHPMFQGLQHAAEAITGQLVGVADPCTQGWISLHQGNEETVHRLHW